jgi:hypothetical protein
MRQCSSVGSFVLRRTGEDQLTALAHMVPFPIALVNRVRLTSSFRIGESDPESVLAIFPGLSKLFF